MGWFNKNSKKEHLELPPSLPEMPRLPELPKIGDELNELPQLPSYPSSSLGKKFSQDVIKDAVSGEKDGDNEVFEADESFHGDMEKTMQKPPISSSKKTYEHNMSMPTKNENLVQSRSRGTEPVFVRMDKFEESLQIFDKAKDKISEMEKLLVEIKRVREKEETELQEWESEIESIKKQFEKIDRNLFSKV